MEGDEEFRVEVTEDRRRGEQRLESVECGLGIGRPYKTLTFAQQVGNREDNARVSIDKTAVKVGKSQECLNIEDRLGDWPFGNGTNAFWVHGDAFGGNDESKETDFCT